MNTNTAVANLQLCWASLDELLPTLTDEQWATQSLCPEWTLHGIVSHLAAIEHMLAGEPADSMAESLPFHKGAEFMAEAAGLDNAALLTRYRGLIETRKAELADMTDADMDAVCMTPVGPGTYGRFMAVRVFDFWVHEQDIRQPLGLPGHESGPAAEMAIDEIQMSLGYIMGKKVGLPDGKSITVDLTGPVQRQMHVIVEGRAKPVEQLADPSVTLTSDSTNFALLACGRIDPQGPIGAGQVTWAGDDSIGETAARNLAFTM